MNSACKEALPPPSPKALTTPLKMSPLVRAQSALWLGFALVATLATIAFISIGGLLGDASRQNRVQTASAKLERVVADFEAAELAQRKHIGQPNPADLQAYRAAVASVRQGLESMRTVALDDAEARRLSTLQESMLHRLESREREAKLEDGGAVDVDRAFKREIHATVAELRGAYASGVASSHLQLQETGWFARYLLGVGGALSLGLLGWVIVIGGRQQREKHRMEGALAASEELRRVLLEGATEGLLTCRPNGTIVSANAAMLRMFGYERAGLVGRNLGDLVAEADKEPFANLLNGLRFQGRMQDAGQELGGLRADGGQLSFRIHFNDLRIEGQHFYAAAIRDVSDQRRSAETLASSERELQLLAEAVPVMVAYIDDDRRFRFHNRAFEQFLGLSRERIVGHTMTEVMGERAYEQLRARIDAVLAGEPLRYDQAQPTVSGEWRDLSIQCLPRYGMAEKARTIVGFFWMATDITDVKRAVGSQLTTRFTQDLAPAVTSIRGSIGLLADGTAGELPRKAQLLVAIAKTNCDRMTQVLQQLLGREISAQPAESVAAPSPLMEVPSVLEDQAPPEIPLLPEMKAA